MASTVVQQVERWFGSNVERLGESFVTLHFRLMHAADENQGKLILEVDGTFAMASITFWNKGEVEVIVLNKGGGNQKEQVLDDRRLTAQDDVASLLDSYFRSIQKSAPDGIIEGGSSNSPMTR